MNNITKEMFESYEKIRRSGEYNMVMDANKVMIKMKLNPRHKSDLNIYFDILQNYRELYKKYITK